MLQIRTYLLEIRKRKEQVGVPEHIVWHMTNEDSQTRGKKEGEAGW